MKMLRRIRKTIVRFMEHDEVEYDNLRLEKRDVFRGIKNWYFKNWLIGFERKARLERESIDLR